MIFNPFQPGLRFKTGAALLVFGLVVSLIVAFVVRGAVLRQFMDLEVGLNETDLARAGAFCDFRQRLLEKLVKKYAFWEDTYRFAGGEYPEYVHNVLAEIQMEDLRVDFIVVMDAQERIIAWRGQTKDPPGGTAAWEEALREVFRLGRKNGQQPVVSGLWTLTDGPVLLAAADILPNDQSGPPRGHLIMGCALQGAFEASMNALVQSHIRILSIGPTPVATETSHRADPRSRVITSQTVLRDMAGRPAVMMEMSREMKQYAIGQKTVNSLAFATVVLTLGGVVFLMVLLDSLVLSRLAQLREAAARVSADQERMLPPQLAANDEIGALARIMSQAFARLHEEQERVRSSEAKYRAVVEQCPEGIFLADEQDWLLLEVNASLETMLGRPRQGLEGTHLDQISGHAAPPLSEVRAAFAAEGRAAFQMPREGQSALNFVLVRIHAAGRSLVCGVVEDLGKREQLQQQLARAEMAETVGQLAGGVAHDFNNLLTVILSVGELLEREPGLSSQGREGVRAITQAARSASELTRKLLLYGRRGPLQLKSCDLGALVRGLKPMLARVIPENIQLEIQAPAGPLPVQADTQALEQAVINLVLNARDAMPRGGCLTLRAMEAADGQAVLEVEDNGLGMSPEVRKHIFEPFFTTKPLGKGSGLGLSMVQGVVRQHGGEVEVESEIGRGSLFRLRLPAATAVEDASSVALSGPSSSGGGELLMLVEDEAAIRNVLGIFLRQSGYEVVEASNPDEALALARSLPRPPALLISDVIMPGQLSGFQLACELSSLFPELKVILMSGYNAEMADPGGEWQGEGHTGGYRFLNKPFNISRLLEEIRSLLTMAELGGSEKL